MSLPADTERYMIHRRPMLLVRRLLCVDGDYGEAETVLEPGDACVGPDGRLWISHGFTFAGRFDDTRAYNFKNERWAGIAPDGRRPGERCLHECFTSADGNLVLYGGQDDSNASLGDAWRMRKDRTWKKQPDPPAKARRLYAVTEAGPYAYVHAGAGRQDLLDDLWRIDRETLEWERVNVPGNKPAARSAGFRRPTGSDFHRRLRWPFGDYTSRSVRSGGAVRYR